MKYNWSSTDDSNHEEGQLKWGGERRLEHFAREEHRRNGGGSDASSSSYVMGATTTTGRTQSYGQTHDLSSSGSITYGPPGDPTKTYTFDSYTFRSSKEAQEHSWGTTQTGVSTSTIDTGYWNRERVEQQASGVAGTFETEQEGNDWAIVPTVYSAGGLRSRKSAPTTPRPAHIRSPALPPRQPCFADAPGLRSAFSCHSCNSRPMLR